MPPAQHPYPGLFTSEKGFRAFTERIRNGHPYPIVIDAQDGGTYPTRVRSTRCSSPTTPPAERRAYAAREQARKAKAQSTSERSTSLPPQTRHTHSHRAHSKREPEPELEYLPQTHKHSTKHHHHHHSHHRKAPRPAERSYRPDSDTESNWSTDVHAPRTPHHSHHHHHHHQHAVHPDHHTLKVPFSCHCRHCLRAAPQTAEAPKEDPARRKHFYERRPHPVPVNPKVPCPCGYVQVETVQEHSSRPTSPDKHGKGHGRHSPEPEEVRPHRRRRRRHRRHRHNTTSSSSDTTTDDEDEASLESDEETRTESEKVGYELRKDWHFCNDCCWGHPVIYILR